MSIHYSFNGLGRGGGRAHNSSVTKSIMYILRTLIPRKSCKHDSPLYIILKSIYIYHIRGGFSSSIIRNIFRYLYIAQYHQLKINCFFFSGGGVGRRLKGRPIGLCSKPQNVYLRKKRKKIWPPGWGVYVCVGGEEGINHQDDMVNITRYLSSLPPP